MNSILLMMSAEEEVQLPIRQSNSTIKRFQKGDIVKLNVGGKVFTSTWDTLTKEVMFHLALSVKFVTI